MSHSETTLLALGWNDHWAAQWEACSRRDSPGRVVRAGRLLRVRTEQCEVLAECLLGRASRPICGDWVTLKIHPSSAPDAIRGSIRAMLPRQNAVVRHAVGRVGPQAIIANVDAIWLVCSLDRDQGIRSLARYQALTRLDRVAVMVVLNKLDSCRDPERLRASAQAQAPELDVVSVSAYTGSGLNHLEAKLLRGQTTALIGPSGVGKSTLVNALTNASVQRTTAVRPDDHRGRHTTSTGQLIETNHGALLIDTPGLRELGLWQPAGFDNSYADILELAQSCRFRDCRHEREPGCHVRRALEEGRLNSERFLTYLELANELTRPVAHAKRARSR